MAQPTQLTDPLATNQPQPLACALDATSPRISQRATWKEKPETDSDN